VPSVPTGPAITTGTLVIRLTDQNGLHPPDIPLEIKGPVNRNALTGPTGTVTVKGHEGRYSIRVVPGCTQLVHVFGGGFANVGLSTGETKTKNLAVRWEHRIAPGPPVYANPPSQWPVGQKVDVRYDAADRCSSSRAPNAEFPTFGFDLSSNLKLVGTPVLRSDKDAHAHVAVSCTRAGAVTLVVRDRKDPSDSLDLAQPAIGYPTKPRCVAS
jgi:hypothetical protein